MVVLLLIAHEGVEIPYRPSFLSIRHFWFSLVDLGNYGVSW